MLPLISLLSFLLPTQLGLHLNNFSSSVYGFKIDYLTPTIYLTDLIILLILIISVFRLKNIKFNKRNFIIFVVSLLFIGVNIYGSSYRLASFYKWIKIIEMVFLGVVLVNNKKLDTFKHFFKPLSYSMCVVCILGIMQFINKGSIGGVFYWLGERSFLFSDPNVAPFSYSTFSHPNSFAGFLLVFGIFLINFKNKLKKKYFWFLASLVFINLILTNSLNVYLSIFVLLLIRFSKVYSFSLYLFDFTQRTISHRLELINASWKMIKENFFFGVGLNNFIPNIPKVTSSFLNAWELQPVHNIFLLVFSEAGIIGLVAFIYLFFSISINGQLIAIILTGLSDHYWLTLQQNLLLFTYVLSLSKKGQK